MPINIKKLISKRRSLQARAESAVRGIVPSVKSEQVFAPDDLRLHFGYHKCLTVYVLQIFQCISREFPVFFAPVNKQPHLLDQLVQPDGRKKLLTVANVYDLDLDNLPPFRGSHVIRDPRDLVVSGYYYHQWTHEEFFRDPDFDWTPLISNPFFEKYVESDRAKYPRGISYKRYISSLEKERGMALEMLRIKDHVDHMMVWNYDDPRFIEIKYEEIIGNEVDVFRRIFEHYGMHPKVIERGLYWVDYFSLKKKSKSATSHTRSGKQAQHRKEFTPRVAEIFQDMYGPVLRKLAYE